MGSHENVFHRLAEFGRKLREPGTDFPEGLEKDLGSNENSQNKSHFQDHLDERMSGWRMLSEEDGEKAEKPKTSFFKNPTS